MGQVTLVSIFERQQAIQSSLVSETLTAGEKHGFEKLLTQVGLELEEKTQIIRDSHNYLVQLRDDVLQALIRIANEKHWFDKPLSWLRSAE